MLLVLDQLLHSDGIKHKTRCSPSPVQPYPVVPSLSLGLVSDMMHFAQCTPSELLVASHARAVRLQPFSLMFALACLVLIVLLYGLLLC